MRKSKPVRMKPHVGYQVVAPDGMPRSSVYPRRKGAEFVYDGLKELAPGFRIARVQITELSPRRRKTNG